MVKRRWLRPADKAKRVFWGIDTEFLASGKTVEDDVHSVQIHDGFNRGFFFADERDLFKWLTRYRPKILYTWTTPPEFGSLKSWGLIGANPYKDDMERVQRFWIEYKGPKGGKHRTLVYDLQPFFAQMRYKGRSMGSVEMIGEFLSDFYEEDLRKLPHPLGEEFGLRAPETTDEWVEMKRYGLRDAQICARAARWFQEEIIDAYIPGVNIRQLYSFGTVAKHYFRFRKINPKKGRRVLIKRSHQHIHQDATFAGRNEALTTGYAPSHYNDVSSLYPITVAWLDVLEIIGVEPITRRELECIGKTEDFQQATGAPYGWLIGDFTSDNQLWGLPIRGPDRNYYVTGTVPNHLYHTYDLMASKAEILRLYGGYKPVFLKNPEQKKYVDLTFKKLEGRYANFPEKYCIKGVLNSSTGKLGQSEPLSMTSNFPAYSTLLAGSHYIDSRIIDMLTGQGMTINYMDTDSFFTERKVEGKMFDLESVVPIPASCNPRINIPVLMDVKGEPQYPGTLIFRSKHYYQNPQCYAFHGWKCFQEDWFKIIQQLPTGIELRRQIKKTFRTRDKRAKKLRIGRWEVLRENYDLERLTRLFRADDKQIRTDYNSYRLAQDKTCLSSRPWTFEELALYSLKGFNETWLLQRDLKLRPEIFSEEYVEKFLEQYAERQAKLVRYADYEVFADALFYNIKREASLIYGLDAKIRRKMESLR